MLAADDPEFVMTRRVTSTASSSARSSRRRIASPRSPARSWRLRVGDASFTTNSVPCSFKLNTFDVAEFTIIWMFEDEQPLVVDAVAFTEMQERAVPSL